MQQISINGNPASGTFTLRFGTDVTAGIGAKPTAAQIENALSALPSIGVGNVFVEQVSTWVFTATFTGIIEQPVDPRQLVGPLQQLRRKSTASQSDT